VAADQVSTGSESGYLYLYESRYARVARLLALSAITGTSFIGRPHPSLSGDGLVILISLVVAVATQLSVTVFPSGPGALMRTVMAALSCGVLVGYEPTVGTAILLIFVGIDAGASLSFGAAGSVTALAVVTTAISVLASGQATGNIGLGAVVVVGFLAAAGRRQFVLRAEEAELRLADIERAREEHALAVNMAARADAAREIHDILAHSLGALVLQLDALDAVLSSETPDRARAGEVLTRARAMAVDGLNEARRSVGSLRDDPPPLVDSIAQLVETSGAGVFEVVGTPRPVPGNVSVALRRTAQEGLTNAAKHATGAVAKVQLAFAPTEVVLTVTDSGRPAGVEGGTLAETGGGFGLEGLRERAQLIGGTLSAGPHEGGWQVRLCVPDHSPNHHEAV
jgi:signal transduction histidine kinase